MKSEHEVRNEFVSKWTPSLKPEFDIIGFRFTPINLSIIKFFLLQILANRLITNDFPKSININ